MTLNRIFCPKPSQSWCQSGTSKESYHLGQCLGQFWEQSWGFAKVKAFVRELLVLRALYRLLRHLLLKSILRVLLNFHFLIINLLKLVKPFSLHACLILPELFLCCGLYAVYEKFTYIYVSWEQQERAVHCGWMSLMGPKPTVTES